MPKKKKLEPVKIPALPEAAQEEKQQVKLRKEFKDRLQRVAKAEGKPMGDLIEEKMRQFVNTAWLKLRETDRHRDDATAGLNARPPV